MRQENPRNRVLGVGLAALVVTAVPACQGQGGPRVDDLGAPITSRQAYRPPYYGQEPARPKLLGSYAGHNYGVAPHLAYSPPPATPSSRPLLSRFFPWLNGR